MNADKVLPSANLNQTKRTNGGFVCSLSNDINDLYEVMYLADQGGTGETKRLESHYPSYFSIYSKEEINEKEVGITFSLGGIFVYRAVCRRGRLHSGADT